MSSKKLLKWSNSRTAHRSRIRSKGAKTPIFGIIWGLKLWLMIEPTKPDEYFNTWVPPTLTVKRYKLYPIQLTVQCSKLSEITRFIFCCRFQSLFHSYMIYSTRKSVDNEKAFEEMQDTFAQTNDFCDEQVKPNPLSLVARLICSDGCELLESEDLSLKEIRRRTAEQVERQLISSTLAKTGGNRAKASRILNVSYRNLLYKLESLNIELPA